MGWLTGYSYRRAITIDKNKVGGSLSNYPYLFNETQTYLKTFANGGKVLNTNGYDIVFTEEDGITVLDFEREEYNAVSGLCVSWVRIPSVDSSANKVIYVYYGNILVSTSQENISGVWDANYKGVWHLNANKTAGYIADSTGNGNDISADTGTTDGVGIVGRGRISAAKCMEALNNLGSLSISGSITVEVFAKPTAIIDAHEDVLLSKNNFGHVGDQYSMSIYRDGTTYYLFFYINQTNYAYLSGAIINDWNYLVGVYDQSDVYCYINAGTPGSVPYSGVLTTDPGKIYLAGKGESLSGDNLTGDIDEIRISNLARSLEYQTTVKNNLTDLVTFYSLGDEEVSTTTDKALLFDGVNDYVGIPSLHYFGWEDHSYETWVYLNNDPGINWYAFLICNGDDTVGQGDSLVISNGASCLFGLLYHGGDHIITSISAVPLHGWHHLVITVGDTGDINATIKFYLDGVLDKTGYISITHSWPGGGSGCAGLGAWIRNGFPNACFLDGAQDEPRNYSKELSQAEVTFRFNLNRGWYGTLPDPGLVAGYHLDDDADDYSGHGYDGTVHGATYIAGKVIKPVGWAHKWMGIYPSKIMGIPIANVAKFMGIA